MISYFWVIPTKQFIYTVESNLSPQESRYA